ncbi:helical backbone metal receptor [Desulfobotulus sp. H1]|uniref:Helical backbone metal receptor n=1 Tax=Desulfobotulus pelophilus TaxID=2823377 RepID=A0ABT3N9L3_9BACT|nr:helical backbone metal receptor [Desulfobotulus pelophilus]MCW7754139.1 helical backbone metal receptor [Desulfobotulus pelophilus]
MKKICMVAVLALMAFAEMGSAGSQRILPMAPSLVEAVFALGAGERVAGIPEYTSWPPEALDLPSVGGYFNPNLERIAVLKPDLVILQGQHEKVDRYCRRHGIPLLHVAMEDRTSIREGLHILGHALGQDAEARMLTDAMEAELERLGRKFYRSKPPAVLLVVGRTPGTLSGIMTAGRDSFLTELTELAGGRNIFDDQSQRYPTVSKEAILVRQPDIILEFMPGDREREGNGLVHEWQAMASVPAVRKGRIRVLTDNRLLMPGPRIAEAAAILGETIAEMMPWED